MYRLTIKDMKILARSKRGKCLSKGYVNLNVSLKWKCDKGHIWEARPALIKQDSWCPICRGLKRFEARELELKKLQNIARKKGGKCLSKEYKGSWTKYKWKCKKGHEWETLPTYIRRGTWCPICSKERWKERRMKLKSI